MQFVHTQHTLKLGFCQWFHFLRILKFSLSPWMKGKKEEWNVNNGSFPAIGECSIPQNRNRTGKMEQIKG